jgi:hypothetical protein
VDAAREIAHAYVRMTLHHGCFLDRPKKRSKLFEDERCDRSRQSQPRIQMSRILSNVVEILSDAVSTRHVGKRALREILVMDFPCMSDIRHFSLSF